MLKAFALAAAVLATPALACSICGCSDPLVSAGDSAAYAGQVRFALEAEHLSATAGSAERGTVEEASQTILRPVLVWSPSDDLNLVFQAPMVRNTEVSGAEEATTDSGLGDVEVGARWFFSRQTDFRTRSRRSAALGLGLSLPTAQGAPQEAHAEGVAPHTHHALGSGGFGPYLGALYAWHRDPFNLTANLGARTFTADPSGARLGERLTGGVQLQLRAWERLAVVGGADARYAWADVSHGVRTEDTGGLVVAATLGFAANLHGPIWLHARAQLPVFTALNGAQTVGPAFFGALQYAGN